MLRTEFEKLTGFYPTESHYSAIEVAYMEFDGDKLEFCRKYKENEDGIAEKIQVEANLAAAADAKAAEESIKEKDLKIKRLEAQIKKLESRIRKMEGWEPYRISHLTTEDYKLLRSSADLQESRASLNGDPERFGDSPDVYAWINDEFGFEQDKIQIVKEIPVYERSADGRIRKTGSHEERLPSYYSTDWNYVRFDAGPYQYEVVDGELYMYQD